ncbi:MAG: sulfatase-like hydrolase/transferase [Saprospiraceae bacterium]|nr:sulfatase-like hydrolase/transferase [Saprospiraceae bacterium]
MSIFNRVLRGKPNWELNLFLAVIYRLLIVLAVFMLCRILFYGYNLTLFPGLNYRDWAGILYGGLKFDIVACLYANSLIVLMSIFPAQFRYSLKYQKIVRIFFIILNSLAILLNCIDFGSYRFTLRRISADVIREFSNEQGKGSFIFQFLIDFWHIVFVFFILMALLIWLYDRIKIRKPDQFKSLPFYIGSTAMYLLAITSLIYGIRGDFKHSSRPLTNSDAGEYVKHPHEIPLVLNSAFCFVRTLSVKFYRKESFFSNEEVEKIYSPVHYFHSDREFRKMNVMVILLESFGKEAIGFYNRGLDNGTFKGYTPFLDSLCSVSRVCINSFANGRKSVDAMPAILAGLPKAEVPFILTPYVSNKIKSLPSILRDSGYTTAFFHGAPNGSMGFKAFTKLVHMDRYYGMSEYNNDLDFDGLWGIWDEPFFQFTAETLDTIRKPFFATMFSLSSHHPFNLPVKHKDSFKEGEHPIHKCLSYSDNALREFFHRVSNEEWFENTLFVIAADHATITQRPEYNTAWGKMSIPIIFYKQGDSSLHKIDSSVIQHTDIAPSILSYLHYKGPFVSFGKNIFDTARTNYAAGYLDAFYWIEDEFLFQYNGVNKSNLYNYIKDPLLQQNLIDKTEYESTSNSLSRKIKAYIQQFHNRMIEDRLTAQ